MRRRRYILRTRKTRKRRVGRPRIITLKRLIGKGVSRPYKDNNRLMLGSGNKSIKQRGGFFPLVAALSGVTPVAELLTKVLR